MTEEEFRSKLDALGRSYSSCINNMNEMDSPNLKVGWRRRASSVIDEIQQLERNYRSSGNKVVDAAWIRFAMAPRDVERVEALGMRSFFCPHCQQAGTITDKGEPGSRATPFTLPGHDYLGDGKFHCTSGPERRIFQEPSLFQSDVAEPVEPGDPWLEQQDALVDTMIEKWRDIEHALAEGAYGPSKPATPKTAPVRRQIHLNKAWALIASVFVALAISQFSQGNIASGFIWLVSALMNLTVATIRGSRSR